MTPEQWSLVASFIAMTLIASSYFWKSKSGFLLFQSIGMVFLMLSYCFDGLYFPMIGLAVGLARALIYYAYEKKDKLAPIFWPYLLSALSIAAYFIVNIAILGTAQWCDLLYLIGLIGYAFIFRIRKVEALRYAVTIPTAISLLYTIVGGAALFAIISYAFELCANIISILKYHVFEKKEEVYEKN